MPLGDIKAMLDKVDLVKIWEDFMVGQGLQHEMVPIMISYRADTTKDVKEIEDRLNHKDVNTISNDFRYHSMLQGIQKLDEAVLAFVAVEECYFGTLLRHGYKGDHVEGFYYYKAVPSEPPSAPEPPFSEEYEIEINGRLGFG